MEGALLRYRVMSYVTGVALLLLFGVAIPLSAAHHPLFGTILGVGHGVFLYPLYLLTVVQLAFLTRLRWWWWLLMLAAGVVPLASFVVEHYATRAIRAGDRSLARAGVVPAPAAPDRGT
jgi:integral membrane protein